MDRTEAHVVELGDRTLLPGFIDCHVHTTFDPVRGLRTAVSDSAALMVLNSLPVLRVLLENSFTTVRDVASFAAEPITIYLRDAINNGIVVGPRMVVAPHCISARGGHGDLSALLGPQIGREIGTLADGVDEITKVVRGRDPCRRRLGEIRCDGRVLCRVGRSRTGFLFTAGNGCRGLHRPRPRRAMHPHPYGDEGITRAVRAGVHCVEHGSLASTQTLALMEQHNVVLVPTQFLIFDSLNHLDDDHYWIDKPQAARTKFRRYADQLRQGAQDIASSSVKIAFGTDAGVFNHQDNWKEFPTMVANGILPLRALRAATSVAADLLARPELGRIHPHACADLIAMPGDPFSDITCTGQVNFVMKAGVIVHDGDAQATPPWDSASTSSGD